MLEFTLDVTKPYIKGEKCMMCLYIYIRHNQLIYKGKKIECMCVYIYTHIHTFFFPIRWTIYIGIIYIYIYIFFLVTPKGEIFVEINLIKTCLLGYFKK